MKPELKTRIDKVIEENAPDEIEIAPDKNLEDDFGMDSLDKTALWLALEEEFDTEIDEANVAEIKTVQDVYDSVSKALED